MINRLVYFDNRGKRNFFHIKKLPLDGGSLKMSVCVFGYGVTYNYQIWNILFLSIYWLKSVMSSVFLFRIGLAGTPLTRV